MDPVSSVSRPPVDCSTAAVKPQTQNDSVQQQAAKVTVSQAQTADITIVTKEGDTVTLSASKTADLSFSTYNAQGQIGGKSVSVSGMSAQMSQTSAFSVTVKGDLNKEEMKEIRQALRIIGKSAHDVLTGHADKAAERTAKLAGLDQLQSIDADIEFKQEVSVTQASSQSTAASNSDATDTSATSASDTGTAPQATTPATTVVAPAPVPDETAVSPAVPPATDTPSVPAAAPAAASTVPANTHLTVLGPSLTGAWWIPTANLWHLLQSINGQTQTQTPKPQSDTPAAAKA